MKKLLFILFFALNVFSRTYFLDEVAKLDKLTNTYNVDSTIEVSPSDTLFVQKGVVVAFSPLTGIELKGTLQAIGDASHEILFTSKVSLKGQGQSYDWRGIQLYSTSSIELKHVRFYYSSTGITSCCDNVIVDHVTFRQNGKWEIMIGNRVLDVPENEPFSYRPITTNPQLVTVNKPDFNKIVNKVYIPKRDFLITPLAIAAGVVGGIYIGKYAKAQSDYKEFKPGNKEYDASTSPHRKEKFDDLRDDIYVNSSVGFSLAGLALTGLTYVTIYTLKF